jgi:glyoxylase-like metal-dependent hydrolase (beta-lactamase superfamily II)
MTNSVPQETTARGLTYPYGMNFGPADGDAVEVADGVHWLRFPLPFSLKFINLYLLEDGDGWTIVDTCVDMPSSRALWLGHMEKIMEGRSIKRVIVTHLHPDHVGLAGWLTREADCELWMSRTDFLMCKTLAADTGKEAPQVALDFYRAIGFDEENLENYRKRFGGFGSAISTLPDSFRRLTDGETFEINGRYWQVVMGSGHAPEHACLYCPGLKVLISGDQVLPRISSNVSVFPTEPDGDPLKDWLDSCAKLREILPNNLLVLPAHQEPFYGLHTRLTRLIEGHETGLDRLYNLLAEPKRVMDCFSALFKRKIGPDLLGLASGETLAHLNCLIGRKLINRSRDENGVDHYVQSKGNLKSDSYRL